MPGFLASGEEEFNMGPEKRLDHLELLYNRVLLKYKKDRESFWHRHSEGGRKRTHMLVFQFSSVQSLSLVQFFVTPWITARQTSLSITNSWSSLKFMSIESVMLSSHLIICHPLILLPPIPPIIRVFYNESTLHIGGQSIGFSASASVLPKNTQDWPPSGWTGWISLQPKGLSRVFSNTTVQKHQFFCTQLSSDSNSYSHTWPLEKP